MESVRLPARAKHAPPGSMMGLGGAGQHFAAAQQAAPPPTPPHSQTPTPALTAQFSFDLPPALEASAPPEARGLRRDRVRLMVSRGAAGQVTHTRFTALPAHLDPGDVLVINTSGTLNAALPARGADGMPLELHLSTRLPGGQWVVEVRQPEGNSTLPFYTARAGETLRLPGGANCTLLMAHAALPDGKVRLWVAALRRPTAPGGPRSLSAYLARHGFPIRYSYVPQSWPSRYYQTVYATEWGSAEMPSAGRALTPRLITRLVARGVQIAPLVLHTGVASPEAHEPPYEEYYRVPAATARLVNAARAAGQRVVAVGTTVVRALETTAEDDGQAHPGEGWTDLVITPERGMRVVDGLLTGLHEPRASHLAMLAALAGPEHVRAAYVEALRAAYLWHEFGDLHLILP
jgi:S-adenosylmethionine:tRNA ribosyltransferase-isomerase